MRPNTSLDINNTVTVVLLTPQQSVNSKLRAQIVVSFFERRGQETNGVDHCIRTRHHDERYTDRRHWLIRSWRHTRVWSRQFVTYQTNQPSLVRLQTSDLPDCFPSDRVDLSVRIVTFMSSINWFCQSQTNFIGEYIEQCQRPVGQRLLTFFLLILFGRIYRSPTRMVTAIGIQSPGQQPITAAHTVMWLYIMSMNCLSGHFVYFRHNKRPGDSVTE